jgi:hypothetical protein
MGHYMQVPPPSDNGNGSMGSGDMPWPGAYGNASMPGGPNMTAPGSNGSMTPPGGGSNATLPGNMSGPALPPGARPCDVNGDPCCPFTGIALSGDMCAATALGGLLYACRTEASSALLEVRSQMECDPTDEARFIMHCQLHLHVRVHRCLALGAGVLPPPRGAVPSLGSAAWCRTPATLPLQTR